MAVLIPPCQYRWRCSRPASLQRGSLRRPLEVHSILAVILDGIEDHRAGVDPPGRLKHLVCGRRGEDLAGACGVEHSEPHESSLPGHRRASFARPRCVLGSHEPDRVLGYLPWPGGSRHLDSRAYGKARYTYCRESANCRNGMICGVATLIGQDVRPTLRRGNLHFHPETCHGNTGGTQAAATLTRLTRDRTAPTSSPNWGIVGFLDCPMLQTRLAG
jgi:hypothetical protein